MKDTELFQALTELAERLDIEIVHEKGDFTGGYCRVVEDRRIVLNKHNLLATKLRVLARNLLLFDLSNVYLVPAIRKYLEEVAEEENITPMITQESPKVEKDR